MKTKTSLRKGFTLIEIMIVVVIIGILAVALFPKLLGAISKSSDEARKAELKSLSVVLLQYKNDSGQYPQDELCMNEAASLDTSGTTLISGGYVNKGKFPKDPNQNNTVGGCTGYFKYVPLSKNGTDAASFALVAKMENTRQGNGSSVPSKNADLGGVAGNLKKGDATTTYYVELGL